MGHTFRACCHPRKGGQQALAGQEGVVFTALCQGFGISLKTGYKWLNRWREAGKAGLQDRSRRPHQSPGVTAAAMVARIAAVNQDHPTWGGRKIHHHLQQRGVGGVPASSTISTILGREGLRPDASVPVRPGVRFAAEAPNDRLQLDFMGHRPLQHGRVQPLTLLDDHSRYALGLLACADQTRTTVQAALATWFRLYGLPGAILADNGPPWGSSHPHTRTQLEVWFLRLGITPRHGRPRHPQTQGKVERFHRTVAADVFAGRCFPTLAAVQAAFDAFRQTSNQDRPHEAVGNRPPDTRDRRSPRVFPEELPPITYGDDAQVRIVTPKGIIKFAGTTIYVGEAFQRLPVGLYPTATDGVWNLHFCAHVIRTVDLQTAQEE